jgi:hypothetical protein
MFVETDYQLGDSEWWGWVDALGIKSYFKSDSKQW